MSSLQSDIEERVARITAVKPAPHTLFATQQRTPEEIEEEKKADRLKAILRGGFPLRSIKALEAAEGPAMVKARQLLPRVLTDGILLLLGPTGRGKTVMATWFADQRQKNGQKPGEFITAYGMFSAVKSTFGRAPTRRGAFGNVPNDGPDAEELIGGWSSTPFLVIDEVQTRAETKFEDGMLEEVINARYGAMLPTVLIANLDAEKAQESLGPRIMDRAKECGGIVDCNWPTYRV